MDGEVLRRVPLPRQLGHAHPGAASAVASARPEKERRRIEAEKRARERARREREAAVARAKYLESLVGCESGLWTDVEGLVATKLPKSYDQAVKLLLDLRDLDARCGEGDFRRRLETFRQAQARKPSFIERLKKAGL